jgi:hypothetical protein
LKISLFPILGRKLSLYIFTRTFILPQLKRVDRLVPASLDFHRNPRDYRVSHDALQRILLALHAPGFFLYAALRTRVHYAQFPTITTPDGRTLLSKILSLQLFEDNIDIHINLSPGYCLVHASRLGALFWAYDPFIGVTRAIYLNVTPNTMIGIFKAGLVEHQDKLRNPQILSLISMSYFIRTIDELCIDEINVLNRTEMTSGYHEYDRVWRNFRQKVVSSKVRLEDIDLGELSVKMSGSAANLSRLETSLCFIGTVLKAIANHSQMNDDTVEGTHSVWDLANFLFAYGDNQLADIKYLQKRVQIQLTAVSQTKHWLSSCVMLLNFAADFQYDSAARPESQHPGSQGLPQFSNIQQA